MTRTSEWEVGALAAAPTPGEVAVCWLDGDAGRPIETVLEHCLGAGSRVPAVRRSSAGKPELVHSPLCVSLAHSGAASLVGVARRREIGVDIERNRPVAGWSLVGHALTRREEARLRALPSPRQGAAFLSIWTRKEAVLKALGVGLTLDPRLIELDGNRIVSAPAELLRPDEWTLGDLPVPGYTAAFAFRGPIAAVRLHDMRTRSTKRHGLRRRVWPPARARRPQPVADEASA
jgi:phosphopantetheinyl transferase